MEINLMDVIFSFFKKVWGLFLLLLSAFTTVAMLLYKSSDISFNTVSTFKTQNLCGMYGAYIADILWQWLGVISFLPLLSIAVIGSVYLSGQKISYFKWRVFLAFVSFVFLFLGLHYGGVEKTGILTNIWIFLGLTFPDFNADAQLVSFSFLFCAGFFFIYAMSIPVCMVVWSKLKIFFKWLFLLLIRKKDNDDSEYEENEDHDISAEKVVDILDGSDGESLSEIPSDKAVPEKKVKQVKNIRTKVLSVGKYKAPSLDFLQTPKDNSETYASKDAMMALGANLQEAMLEYSIHGKVVNFKSGPVVTLYEFLPDKGVKISRIVSLSEDIARSMSSSNIRIAPIPNTSLIGVEIPNKKRRTVLLKELLATEDFKNANGKLCLALGKDIMGQPVYANLEKIQHLLVAGTTGSGKSVAINTIIMSLLYRLGPDECKLIMVDPKMLELSIYNDIPHLLTPVITDPPKVVAALKWAVKEMNNRYRMIGELNVRNMEGYNEKVRDMIEKKVPFTRTVQTGFDEDGRPITETVTKELKTMPYIVIIIDEMADLMLFAKKDINALIQSLAQKARAAGIHVIMATQRPSVDVITGVIKANFPARISFQVTSSVDSRTILNEQGAEHLLGMGDMLFLNPGKRPVRIQCPFVSDEEVENITNYLRSLGPVEYVDEVTADTSASDPYSDGKNSSSDGGEKDIYEKAVEIVRTDRKTSISYLQRRLSIGYNKAATLIEHMEEDGIVSKPDSTNKREIL